MLVGDILEVVGCAFAAVATYLLILTLGGPTLALVGAFFVIAAFLAYVAQGYATVQLPRPRLRPRLPRLVKRASIDEDPIGWLPDSVTWDQFKHLLSMHTGQPQGSQLAKAELDRLRASRLVRVEGVDIKRTTPRREPAGE